MKKSLIFPLLFLLLNCAFGNVIIEEKLINVKVKGSLYYSAPIDGFSNLYYDSKEIVFENDSSFKLSIPVSKPGLLYLFLPQRTVKIYVGTTDHISVRAEYQYDSAMKAPGIKTLHFEGTNAGGHATLNRSFQSIQQYVDGRSLCLPAYSLKELFEKVVSDFSTLLHPYDSLMQNAQIDSTYFNLVTGSLKSEFALNLMGSFEYAVAYADKPLPSIPGNILIRTAVKVNHDLFQASKYDTLRRLIYEQFDPFDNSILSAGLGTAYTVHYCNDLFTGFLKESIKYDDAFHQLNNKFQYLGYLKGRFLELLWSKELYYQTMVDPKVDELVKSYEMFASYFPDSKMLPYLKERIERSKADAAFEVENPKIIDLGKKRYSTLKDLVAANFKNEYVFIDLWATWCSPCISEFSYKNELGVLLDKHKIKLLYISIDMPTEKAKWNKIISDREIFGNHIIASKELQTDIEKRVYHGNENVTVPRYILLNKKGKIIAYDLPRPSNMAALKEKIEQLTAGH